MSQSRSSSRSRLIGGAALFVASAAAGTAAASTASGTLALTTDYVWRGTTQTQGDPAVQGSAKIAWDNGVYASVWASNVEFASATHASSEFDLSLGWSGAPGDDWTLDVNLLHYRYPSTTIDLDWTELNGTLTYTGNYWASLGWSNEALGFDESGTYLLLGARFPLSDAFRVEANAGYYTLEDLDGDDEHDSYVHGALSAIWAFDAPFEARVTLHAIESAAEDFFGEAIAGDRIEAALQASF